MSGYVAVAGQAVAAYAAVTALLLMASVAVPRAGFVARVLAAYATLVVSAFINIAAAVALRLAGKSNIAQWAGARVFHGLMRRTIGVSFVVDDPRRLLASVRPAVFVGNHQTELDVVMLGAMFPKYCSVTAKSDLKHVPFLGWFMHASGTIFIDRRNSKGAREAMQGAARQMRAQRQSVYIFPEGTRSYAKEPVLLPFKKGAFHLAIQAGVPIIPCVVANYSHIFCLKDMVFTSGTVPVKGGGAPPPSHSSRLELTRRPSARPHPHRRPHRRRRRPSGSPHSRRHARRVRRPHRKGQGPPRPRVRLGRPVLGPPSHDSCDHVPRTRRHRFAMH